VVSIESDTSEESYSDNEDRDNINQNEFNRNGEDSNKKMSQPMKKVDEVCTKRMLMDG